MELNLSTRIILEVKSCMDKKMLKRAKVFVALVIIIFIVLAARLAYIQIVNHEYYWERAEKNRFRILPVTAPRGEIFDSEGNELVTNRPGFTVSLVDLGEGYSQETITSLSDILDMEEDEIWEIIGDQYYHRYHPIRLKTDVSEKTVAKIAERRVDLPGVVIEVQPVRNYAFDEHAAHLLGYLGEGAPSQARVDQWKEEGYELKPGDIVGQSGLELVWEPFLRGEDGGVQVEVDATGQPIREFEQVDPTPGADIYLTLNTSLQLQMEENLENAVQELREEGNNRAGEASAVALNPQNGEIMGMASIPSYDPNTIREEYTELVQDTQFRPLTNKAIRESYPIGSSFKMVSAMAALQEGEVGRGEIINCQGSITRHGATKSCYGGTVHGAVNIVDAIKQSCNVFFYKMGLRVGISSLAEYSREFGFGSPTGLTDISGEIDGIVASREYKAERFDGEPWYPAETMDAAIGQSFHSITPLQLANYVSMIANGGIHYRPYVVDKVVAEDGSILKNPGPEEKRHMDVNEVYWDIIKEGMVLSTGPGGTASFLDEFPLKVAGKTGTAQVVGKDGDISPHSVFVAFAPADDPEIALAVFVNHGGTGGATAAPVAKEILKDYFKIGEEDLEEEIEGDND